MSKPRIVIVYESYHHYNTEKIAQVIAQKLQADLFKSSEATLPILSDYSIIGIGTGIYWGKPHKNIQAFLNTLPILTRKKSFLFISSGIVQEYYIKRIVARIIHKMEEKGLTVIDFFVTRGWDTFGPLVLIGGINKGHPNSEDLYKAELFAKRLLNEL